MLSIILSLVLMLVVVGVDQLTKYLVITNMELEQSIKVIPGVFNFTYIQNTGAAFGSMSEHRWIFMVLSTVAIIAIIVYLFWKKPQNKLMLISLSLITGGGIGNMIDRLFRWGINAEGDKYYFVVDFLDFCAFPNIWKWVFNVADACVCIGAGMLALWMILDLINEEKQERAKKAAIAKTLTVDESKAEEGYTDEPSDDDSYNEDSDFGAEPTDTENNDE